MQLIENQTFTMLKDRNAGSTFSDMIFRNCLFDNCSLSSKRSDGRRSEVRNIQIDQCKSIGCQIGPAVFEDVTVTNSTASDLSIFWGSVFRRVTFSGRVSALKINTHVTALPDAQTQDVYDRSRLEFYEHTDWAIDISNARFTSFDCEGVPARLFRLDLETQGIVRRQNVPSDWRTKFYEANAWGPWVSHLLGSKDENAILATPLTKPKKARDRYLNDLRMLRSLGIVDPAVSVSGETSHVS